jgi:L-alanine-DL-glutamate epimerase-like enolase superfamily enzyme
VELEQNGHVGYGEVSLPPYLAENQQTAISFYKSLDFNSFNHSEVQWDELLNYVHQSSAHNNAAKAALDIAIHDLKGKIKGQPCWKMFGSDPQKMPLNSCTIGIDKEDIIIKKIEEAKSFKVLKIKLGTGNEQAFINTLRKHTDKPLYIDVNQGWTDIKYAEEMAYWLKEKGAVLLEQPMQKDNLEGHALLKEKNILPIFADESFQNCFDLKNIQDAFDGINIKLMKCGGLRPALEIIKLARKENMKILMGCMNESSCATMAAAALAPLCDYADLDGPSLINNNPFEDYNMAEGKIILSDKPGLGLKKSIFY